MKRGADNAGLAEEITEYVDKKQSICLNTKKHTCEQLFSDRLDEFVESDSDEQLLLTVPFLGDVKISSLRIIAPSTGHAPKTLKLFLNNPHMDFQNAESKEPVQTITLQAKDYTPVETQKAKSSSKQNTQQQTNNNGSEQTQAPSNSNDSPDNASQQSDQQDKLIQADVQLRFVKFQKVSELIIFVVDNLGGKDKTIINKLHVFGSHTKKITKVEQVLE